MWSLVGRGILAVLGFAATRPLTTIAGAAVADQFATSGAGRDFVLDRTLPDSLNQIRNLFDNGGNTADGGGDVMNRFQNFLSSANIGGAIGAGLGFLMGSGMLGRTIFALALGMVGNFLYGQYLKGSFNLASGASQQPEAKPSADPGNPDLQPEPG